MEKKPSAVPTVFSVIALVISALALVSVIVLFLISAFGTESGGTATALTGRAVFFVSGIVIFSAATWILAMIGGAVGFIMLIVDIAIKRTNILWMPITAMVLGIVSIISSLFVF